jgi:hypothetical protein
MGIDATIPDNVPASRYNRIVYYNQGKVQLKDYLDSGVKHAAPTESSATEAVSEKILSELANSHRFFAELLELFPQTDYRAIATALGALQEQGRINQDGDGKYQMKQPTSLDE